MIRKIWVTFQRAGLHRYPAAPDDVSYLASTHRHLFKFKVTISVVHNDRDIEFHQFLNWLESLYAGTLTLDFKSCEMIAEELLGTITTRYPDRFVEVEVSEDGECGAVLSNEGHT
jgi:hypothetical protein